MLWIFFELAVCLFDSLLLYMLVCKYTRIHFGAETLLPLLTAAILSFIRVHYLSDRIIAPFIAIFVSWCVCMCFKLRPLGSFIVALLYFVFIEISELLVMGIFTLVLRSRYAEFAELPMFNLVGILFARLIFIGIINSGRIEMQFSAPVRYRLILTSAIFMITVCMECICLVSYNTDPETRLTFSFISIIMFAIIVLVFLLFNSLTHFYTAYYESREIANSLKANEKFYSTLAAGNEQTRLAVHDCKNHIFTAMELLRQKKIKETEEYLQSVAGTLDRPYKSYLQNSIADIVITQKAELAEKAGVKLSVTGVMGEVNIKRTDMSSLISNLLDNAIEAAAKCQGGFVQLKVKMQGDYIYISTLNSIAKMPVIVGTDFVTTKPDRENHGMGIKIIKDIVHRYNGEFDFSAENGVITIYVLLKPPLLSEESD